MIATNFSTVRENFKNYCDAAVKDAEVVMITRKNDENVVLISAEEYSNLIENLYVRSNQADYKSLLESIKQLKTGKGQVRELLEDE